jgi:hypothetical protein
VVIVQVLPAAHCVSHDPPHAPVQDAPAAHESLHPCVAAWHCPVEPKLHVVLLGQAQATPEQEGLAIGPASDEPPSEDGVPNVTGEVPLQPKTKRTRKLVVYLIMPNQWGRGCSRLRSSSPRVRPRSGSEWPPSRHRPTTAAL